MARPAAEALARAGPAGLEVRRGGAAEGAGRGLRAGSEGVVFTLLGAGPLRERRRTAWAAGCADVVSPRSRRGLGGATRGRGRGLGGASFLALR